MIKLFLVTILFSYGGLLYGQYSDVTDTQEYIDAGDVYTAFEKELSKASEPDVEDESTLHLLVHVLLLQGKSAEAAILVEKVMPKEPASIDALVANVGDHAMKQEFVLAREKLDAALLIDPKSASTWSLLGDIELREKHLDSAEEAYSRAIEYRLNNLNDHFKRSLVRIQLRKLKEAQQDIDLIKKSSPQNAGANYAQGLIFYHNKNYPDAVNSFEITLSDEGRYPLALLYLGASYFLQNNLEQAETYAKRFVYSSPMDISGRKLLAMIKFKKQQYGEAEELIRPVVDSRKEDIVALNLLSGALIKQGKMEEAINPLSKLAALQPDSSAAQLRLGAGLLAEGEQDSSLEHLETAIQLKPDNRQAKMLLVLNYLYKKDYDAALKAANTFREQNPASAVPYNLIGKVYLAANQKKKAQEAFYKAGELAPGNPYAYQNLAVLALKDKDFDKARGYYQVVLKYHENHLPTLLNLAVIDGLTKDEKSMVGRLQQAIEAHPKAVTPRLVLARYYLTKDKPDKALFLVKAIGELQKNSLAVLEVIAMSHLAKNEYKEARIILEKLLALQPASAGAHYLLARAYAGLKKPELAKAELRKVVALTPNNLQARLLLARVFLLEKNKTAAQEQLEVLKKLAPESAEVLLIEASVAKLNANPEEARRLTEKAFEASPTTSSLIVLSRQKNEMGDREGALELLEGWVKKYPDDILAHTVLADFYAADQQMDMAIKQYSRALEINGNNLVALNNLAWYLRDTNPQQALEYAKRANEINPESAALIDTLAMVLFKNGDFDKAQRTISRALVKAPGNLTMRYHSAVIDASAGDKTSAIKTLKALLEEGQDFPEKEEATKLLAQLKGT